MEKLTHSSRPFFPHCLIQDESPRGAPQSDALPMESITPHEIEAALMKMAPWKGPGPDGLPVVVWQQVWPAVKHWVVEIFQASLRLSYFPNIWKVAKIVVFPKGGRDPSLPKSYRPISLATPGKALEAVVANRISAPIERHQLLPSNHSGAVTHGNLLPCKKEEENKGFNDTGSRSLLSSH